MTQIARRGGRWAPDSPPHGTVTSREAGSPGSSTSTGPSTRVNAGFVARPKVARTLGCSAWLFKPGACSGYSRQAHKVGRHGSIRQHWAQRCCREFLPHPARSGKAGIADIFWPRASTWRLDFPYGSVVAGSECPSQPWTVAMGTPLSSGGRCVSSPVEFGPGWSG
jgi:hypothetical protein